MGKKKHVINRDFCLRRAKQPWKYRETDTGWVALQPLGYHDYVAGRPVVVGVQACSLVKVIAMVAATQEE